MSVRARVKTLAFHDGGIEWWGDFCHELTAWNAKFRLELHGDDAVYGGIASATPFTRWEPQLNWGNLPPGDRRFLANLERFVGMAFRMSVDVSVIVEPVSMDKVEEEYLAEEDEEEEP
jgi:hypothetical protein